MVTEQELIQLLHDQGWGFKKRARWATGRQYLYAQRRISKKVIQRYICSEDAVSHLTTEQVLSKLKV